MQHFPAHWLSDSHSHAYFVSSCCFLLLQCLDKQICVMLCIKHSGLIYDQYMLGRLLGGGVKFSLFPLPARNILVVVLACLPI